MDRLSSLAGYTTRKTLEKILLSQDSQGFMSDPIIRLCEALDRDPDKVILAVKQARRQGIAPDGPEPGREKSRTAQRYSALLADERETAALPRVRKRFEVKVPGDRSIHDVIDEKHLIALEPGESLEFLDYNKHAQWAHDPHAGVKRMLIKHRMHFPDWGNKFADDRQLKEVCRWLDNMLDYVVRHIIGSYAMPGIRKLLQNNRHPNQWLIDESQKLLRMSGRDMSVEAFGLCEHVADVKRRLMESRRAIDIDLRQDGTPQRVAALAFWARAEGKEHLEDLARGVDRAEDIVRWLGPKGYRSPTSRPHYPLPSAAAGSCVCACGTFTADEAFKLAFVRPFAEPQQRIVNDTPGLLHCFLLCNDDRPGDNIGFVQITCRITAPAGKAPCEE